LRGNSIARYRVTITGPNNEAMADLIRKYKIQVLDHGIRYNKETGYLVDAITQPTEMRLLEAAGYHIERHEDVDEVGKARQKEVGKGNRYKQHYSSVDPAHTSSEES
jgi:carboxypeptidase T